MASNVVPWTELVARSRTVMEERQAVLFSALSPNVDWHYDLDEAVIEFSEAGSLLASLRITLVGTVSKSEGTWLWSWANETLPPEVTRGIEGVRAFGAANGYSLLVTPEWPIDEKLMGDVVAVAGMQLDAAGYFRSFSGDLALYLLLHGSFVPHNVESAPPTNRPSPVAIAGQTEPVKDADHDHVAILAGHAEDGAPVLEQIPARRLADGLYEVLGTPGLAYGCAAGDEVSVDADGRFAVKVNGGNVALHIYCDGMLDQESLARLRQRFSSLNGTVEAPTPPRFAVVTVPASAGFPQIEEAIDGWAASQNDVEWNYGNVYDDDGNPLNWW